MGWWSLRNPQLHRGSAVVCRVENKWSFPVFHGVGPYEASYILSAGETQGLGALAHHAKDRVFDLDGVVFRSRVLGASFSHVRKFRPIFTQFQILSKNLLQYTLRAYKKLNHTTNEQHGTPQ
jgi:hypothetical protein